MLNIREKDAKLNDTENALKYINYLHNFNHYYMILDDDFKELHDEKEFINVIDRLYSNARYKFKNVDEYNKTYKCNMSQDNFDKVNAYLFEHEIIKQNLTIQ